MGKVFIGLICLVFGTGVGAFAVAPIMSGVAAGAGVATGLSAGICSTVQAAQEEGLLDAAQIDQVLNRAAADMSELSGTSAPDGLVGGLDECAAVMDRLRAVQ